MKTCEEQIAEMAKDLKQAKDLAMGTVGSLNNGFGGWYGAYMYNQGYRKQSDTAREILKRITNYSLDYNYDLKLEVQKIAEDYGVEVKE